MQKKTEQLEKADNKRRMHGVVVRRSGEKTVLVEIARPFQHSLYRKQATRTERYLAHDPSNAAEPGMEVVIRESRPLSARKRWIIETIKSDGDNPAKP